MLQLITLPCREGYLSTDVITHYSPLEGGLSVSDVTTHYSPLEGGLSVLRCYNSLLSPGERAVCPQMLQLTTLPWRKGGMAVCSQTVQVSYRCGTTQVLSLTTLSPPLLFWLFSSSISLNVVMEQFFFSSSLIFHNSWLCSYQPNSSEMVN